MLEETYLDLVKHQTRADCTYPGDEEGNSDLDGGLIPFLVSVWSVTKAARVITGVRTRI